MACKIRNLSRRLVTIPGNSGQTWHLLPGASIEVVDVEVADNARVKKLEAQGLVSLQSIQESIAPAHEKEKGRKQTAAASLETSSKGE